MKVLLKYHLMEEGRQPLADLVQWAEGTSLLRALWLRWPPGGVASSAAWKLSPAPTVSITCTATIGWKTRACSRSCCARHRRWRGR